MYNLTENKTALVVTLAIIAAFGVGLWQGGALNQSASLNTSPIATLPNVPETAEHDVSPIVTVNGEALAEDILGNDAPPAVQIAQPEQVIVPVVEDAGNGQATVDVAAIEPPRPIERPKGLIAIPPAPVTVLNRNDNNLSASPSNVVRPNANAQATPSLDYNAIAEAAYGRDYAPVPQSNSYGSGYYGAQEIDPYMANGSQLIRPVGSAASEEALALQDGLVPVIGPNGERVWVYQDQSNQPIYDTQYQGGFAVREPFDNGYARNDRYNGW